MSPVWSLAVFLSCAVSVAVAGRGFPAPSEPGCDCRPNCSWTEDEHCKDAVYFKDQCFTGVYWQCAFGQPVPNVCPLGLVVNQAAIDNPNDTSVSLCDWPAGEPSRALVNIVTRQDVPECGCSPHCNIPPVCPTEIPENCDCNGSIYLPFACDCQFYWTCDANHVPHLSACRAGLYFEPRGRFSGNCIPPPAGIPSTPQVPAEAIACCDF